MVKAIFLDRDGTLNELVKHGDEYTAPWSALEFRFLPGAKEAVDMLKSAGFKTYVVTNQPDMLDGKLPQHDLDMMNKMVKNWLGIDEVLCAMQRGANFYKPNTGMIDHLIRKNKVLPHKSYIIGDRWKDIVPGHICMLTTIFLGDVYTTPTEYEHIRPDYYAKDILDAARLIMEIEE